MTIIGNPVGSMAPRADWGQKDTQKAGYILNKPDLSVYVRHTAQALEEGEKKQARDNIGAVSQTDFDGIVSGLREDLTYAENDIRGLYENIPDTTLEQAGKAADAKATGDALAKLKPDSTLLKSGVPADSKATGDAIGRVRIDLDKIADYPVETGTEESTDYTGTWYFEKWESGKAVCYGLFDFGDIKVSTSWGSIYQCGSLTKDFPAGLFVDVPVWDLSVAKADGGAFVVQQYANDSTAANTGKFYLARPTSFTMTGVVLGFHAIGRWKAEEEVSE